MDRPPVVILVRPQLGENVGTVARAMLNFGLDELRLVQPKCGWPNVKAVNAASGATEVLNRLRVFASVQAATADLHLTLATTARPRDLPKRVVEAAGAALEIRAAAARGLGSGLLFGPERTGLSNDDLLHADAVLTVPLNPAFSSLNLAQAVLIVAYEWFRAGAPPAPSAASEDPARPATKGEVDRLFDHLLEELDAVDFFRAADRRLSLARTIRLILERAGLREPDVHLLHGIVKALVRGAQGKGPRKG
ncbi:MAG: RNA methyltransferase [Geminicoccaceae bacterium]|nr:RNA methyltransferase [Geminicoccaceae bacterium]